MYYEEIKDRIWTIIFEYIEVKNMFSKASLATKLGVAKSTVGDWIKKISIPNATLIPALCEAFGITIYELYGLPESDTKESRDLFKAFLNHPDRQDSIRVLLDIKQED